MRTHPINDKRRVLAFLERLGPRWTRWYCGIGLSFSTLAVALVPALGGNQWIFRNPTPTIHSINQVAYASGLWVALSDGGEILTSSDGTNWNLGSTGGSGPLYDVHYANGLWVVAGESVFSSPDGMTWTMGSAPRTFSGFRALHHAEGLWVAVGDLPEPAVATGIVGSAITSSDGITWTERSTGNAGGLTAVEYGDGLWVAVGDGSILTSTNGVSWISRCEHFSEVLYDIHHADAPTRHAPHESRLAGCGRMCQDQNP